MIPRIRDIELPFRSELDAMRLPEAGLNGRPSIARKAHRSIARDRFDAVCSQVYLANRMIAHVRDIEIPFRIETNFMRSIERSLQCRSPIARKASLSVANDSDHIPLIVYLSHPMAIVFAKPQRSIRSPNHPEWIVQRSPYRSSIDTSRISDSHNSFDRSRLQAADQQ